MNLTFRPKLDDFSTTKPDITKATAMRVVVSELNQETMLNDTIVELELAREPGETYQQFRSRCRDDAVAAYEKQVLTAVVKNRYGGGA